MGERKFLVILFQIGANLVALRDLYAFIYNPPIPPGISTHIDPLHQDGIADPGMAVCREVSVMEMEPRGWIIWLYSLVNQRWEELAVKAKPLET